MRYKKTLFFGIVIFAIPSLIIIIINAGSWLVINDDLQNADAIIVLMGSSSDRMLQSSEIYELGYSEKILMVNTYTPAKDLLIERGYYLKSNTEVAKEMGIALGIPDESILILPGDAKSTRDEAAIISAFIAQENSISKVILITSSYHSRRSSAIFRRAFSKMEEPINIITIPSKYTEFNTRRWYSDRESAKRVVMEYTRLFYFWIWERWKI